MTKDEMAKEASQLEKQVAGSHDLLARLVRIVAAIAKSLTK